MIFDGCCVTVGGVCDAVTVNVALLLVALPAELLTTQRKRAPLSPITVPCVVYDNAIAPEIFDHDEPPLVLRCHWYDKGAVPEAVTEKVAVAPVVTLAFDGCCVIAGATAGGFTVKTAVLLVALPAELLTVQR